MTGTSELPAISGAEFVTLDFDDVTLGGYAWWTDDRAPAVLLLHGWGEDASTMAPVAGEIRSQSRHAISISMRGWRGSSGTDDYGLSAAKDIGRVIHWIRQRPDVSSVVLLGFSMGGLFAALAAAEHNELAGLIVVSAPSDLPLFYRDTAFDGVRRYLDATLRPHQWHTSSPISHAPQLVQHPMLVAIGTLDSMTPPSQGERLAAAAHARLLEIDGMNHHPTAAQWQLILAEASLTFGL